MSFPREDDYIDIHVHDGKTAEGIFILESLMTHENKLPQDHPGVAYTYGIHPWFLTEANQNQYLRMVEELAHQPEIIAIGEAGFDKLRGPSYEIQGRVFEEQVRISEMHKKPLIIHCVRAWDELLSAFKKIKPSMPWMIHGFRGKPGLAAQLVSKGFYLSFWFNFVMRPESSNLLRTVPRDRIFLETDGAEVDIREIYGKVSDDLGLTIGELKEITFSNFNAFFNITKM